MFTTINSQFSQFIRPESFLFFTSRNTVEGADGAPSPFIDRSPAPLNMALGVAFVLSLILVIGHHQEGPGSLAKTFTFPEYPYKETTKNELLFRQFEQACEESGACKMQSQHRSGDVAKTRCIRECVSPSCYKEIYLFDQLEEGEIDVRLNSFKGCFMQRNGRPRK
ncbi:hypothetical protein ACFW04_002311 [Cataglyphis niger]